MKTPSSRVVNVCSSPLRGTCYKRRMEQQLLVSFTQFKLSVVICQTLPSSRPSFAVVCTPTQEWPHWHGHLASESPLVVESLHTHLAGWSSQLGFPPSHFCIKHIQTDKSGRKRGKYLPHVSNLYDYIKLDWVITRVRAAFWWGIWSRSVIHC